MTAASRSPAKPSAARAQPDAPQVAVKQEDEEYDLEEEEDEEDEEGAVLGKDEVEADDLMDDSADEDARAGRHFLAPLDPIPPLASRYVPIKEIFGALVLSCFLFRSLWAGWADAAACGQICSGRESSSWTRRTSAVSCRSVYLLCTPVRLRQLCGRERVEAHPPAGPHRLAVPRAAGHEPLLCRVQGQGRERVPQCAGREAAAHDAQSVSARKGEPAPWLCVVVVDE